MKIQLPLSPFLILGPLASSYLVTQHWGREFTESLIQAGVWSEEIFRGDRLPALPFPETTQTNGSRIT